MSVDEKPNAGWMSMFDKYGNQVEPQGGFLVTYEMQKALMREVDFATYWKWEGRDLRALVLRLEEHVKRFK